MAMKNPRRSRRRRSRKSREAAYETAAANPRKRSKKRRSRRRAASEWSGQKRRHSRAAKKGWRSRRRRGTAKRRRPGHRKHSVRGHYRRSRGRRIHVKRHRSHEANETANPRRSRRRRSTRRRSRRAAEWYGQPRRHSRAAKKGWRRRKSRAAARRKSARLAARRRRRSSRRRYSRPARRRSRRRSTRRRAARRSGRRGTRRSARRATRRRSAPRIPLSRRLPPASEMMLANPLYGMDAYGMGSMGSEESGFAENPLTGGELALAFVSGGVGFALADVLDRYLATAPAGKEPAGLSNAQAVDAAPNVTRMLAQAGLTALPFIGAYFVKQPMGRAALQGMGLGAGLHLVGQVIKGYVFANLLKNNDTSKRLYGEAIAANAAAAAAAPATPSTPATTGTQGVGSLPFGLGYATYAPTTGKVSLGYSSPGPMALGQAAPTGAPLPTTIPTPSALTAAMNAAAQGTPVGAPCMNCGQSADDRTASNTMNALTKMVAQPATPATMTQIVMDATRAAQQGICAEGGGTYGVQGVPFADGSVGAPPSNGVAHRKVFNTFPE